MFSSSAAANTQPESETFIEIPLEDVTHFLNPDAAPADNLAASDETDDESFDPAQKAKPVPKPPPLPKLHPLTGVGDGLFSMK